MNKGFRGFLASLTGANKNEFTELSKFQKQSNGLAVSVINGSARLRNLVIEIKNNTNMKVYCGDECVIEQKRLNNWYRMEDSGNYEVLSTEIDANATVRQEVNFLHHLSKGQYRLVKSFMVKSESFECDAEFTVK